MRLTFNQPVIKFLILLPVLFLLVSCTGDITLVGDPEKSYNIILPEKAQLDELKAASLFQRYVQSSTGYKLPIMRDRLPVGNYEICLGATNRRNLIPPIEGPQPGQEGYRIVSDSGRLFIYGGSPRGTLNGVGSFLEKYPGVRVYSSEVISVPENNKLLIPKHIDLEYNPPVKFRTTHYRDTWTPTYSVWHKLNHKKNGSHPDWGYWVHTFNTLVPPELYFAEHPEYYAEVNGNRVPTQLCLTNPYVYEITRMNLKKAMDERPDLTYWSVSQNDNISFCQCDECKKIDEQEGTPMGSILSFVNRIAAEFPDKVISTLAYQYSRQAPRNLVPAHNVNIMLCTIELNRSIPIRDDPSSAPFRKDMEDWARITDDIILWDYVVQFENLVSPFPNLRVLQPNLQYFVENHADKHFQQGNREVGGEFAELRAYMIAKLLWDPYVDIDEVMDDFLDGYYGKAGKFIRKYIDRLHDELERSGDHLNIFGHPSEASRSWLSADNMRAYELLFDKAEKAVKSDPDVLERVKIARMPLEYAKVEISLRLGTAEGGMYIKDKSGKWMVSEDIKQTTVHLVELANKQGVTRFKEWHTTPSEYLASLARTWEIDMQDHLALNKDVSLKIPASEKYSGGYEGLITDGLRGPRLTFSYNWLGFEGEECEATVNLGSPVKVTSINSSWLNDSRSWVFYPERIIVSGSSEGENWEVLGQVENMLDQQGEGLNVQDFILELDSPVEVNFIRIQTESLRLCPEWHPGSGSPSWIFIDEIIVK